MTDIVESEAAKDATKSTLSDSASSLSRRSSSQASHTSSGSRKVKTIRGSKNRPAKPTTPSIEDAALTSFPSFSPEPDENKPPTVSEDKPVRTVSQRVQARKATLAGLTSPGLLDRSNALFDDSPRSSLDIPGSLHLANDEHIKRLVERVGPIKLVRQYAEDLAKRDAELSALRLRADERERELKRMLKEVDVSSADIEKRLLRLEKPIISTMKESSKTKRTSIDTMIREALSDAQNSLSASTESPTGPGLPQPRSAMTRRLKSTASVSQLQNENVLSRDSSRASSVISGDERDSTIRPRQANTGISRVVGLQNIFQPPSGSTSYFLGGSNKTLTKTKAADELSVKSTQSAKSTTSWTRIFGGRNTSTRSRASSVEQSNAPKDDSLASAKLRTAVAGNNGSKTVGRGRPQPQRTLTGGTGAHTRKESNASNLPPTVELDSMIDESQLPPTMTKIAADGLLVDRFGFIYDRKRKRQQAASQKHTRSKPSTSESLASFRAGDITPPREPANRPATPVSIDEDLPKKSWQDYLLPAPGGNTRRPRELLSHTPSAGAVVTVNTADAEGTITPPRHRDVSNPVVSLMQKSKPSAAAVSETQSSTATVSSITQDTDSDQGDLGASKALLDQLTDLHDNLQAERTIKWNDFLRRVRAERASTTSDRAIVNAPEAELVNGELIGIATLGRSNKTKAKYIHFKSLVLSGIPVALRPKIWAECSGASSLRVPGYYEDLVARSKENDEIQADIAQQITADVKRTLRDNVFFRDPNATGVRRLEELLRAYSLHNPRIGYCQGMNLITGSLLLICATSEDCFWLLVAIIDYIVPSGYFDESLLVARADQLVLRTYVAEVLPRLDAKLTELGVELEACTFHWFLSLYTGILTGGEALYRVWDVVLCLNSSDSAPIALQPRTAASTLGVEGYLSGAQPPTPTTPAMNGQMSLINEEHDGTSSSFLFQLSLALLKLNEEAIIALDSPAQVYTYLNHNMTAHNITIDALINASELLRSRIKRSDVLDRRKKAVDSLR